MEIDSLIDFVKQKVKVKDDSKMETIQVNAAEFSDSFNAQANNKMILSNEIGNLIDFIEHMTPKAPK